MRRQKVIGTAEAAAVFAATVTVVLKMADMPAVLLAFAVLAVALLSAVATFALSQTLVVDCHM